MLIDKLDNIYPIVYPIDIYIDSEPVWERKRCFMYESRFSKFQLSTETT
jgi:hypothetical protein